MITSSDKDSRFQTKTKEFGSIRQLSSCPAEPAEDSPAVAAAPPSADGEGPFVLQNLLVSWRFLFIGRRSSFIHCRSSFEEQLFTSAVVSPSEAAEPSSSNVDLLSAQIWIDPLQLESL